MAGLAVALAGCAGAPGGLFGGPAPEQPAAGAPPAGTPAQAAERQAATTLFGQPVQSPGATMPAPLAMFGCPQVTVREGTATYQVSGPGPEPGTVGVRFQGTISELARECVLDNTTLSLKVGVEGRVLLGMVGQPGQYEVPVRIAVVRAGISPETLWTRLLRVSVTIPPNENQQRFVHVEDNISVTLANPSDLGRLVVYVGFDPAAEQPPPRRGRQRS